MKIKRACYLIRMKKRKDKCHLVMIYMNGMKQEKKNRKR